MLLFVGLFMMLQGSSLSSSPVLIDFALMAVGAILTISYLPLMGRYLEKRFKAKETLTYLPILAILGAVTLLQAIFRALLISDRVAFAVVGIVLLIVPSVFIYRAARR